MTERRALEQQLRHAQKFEAIGQLAGGIAHDFNNVIGAILGWAELGEDQAASSNATLEGYFKKIHAQCDRVTALVQQLLAFARRQILEPRSFSLNQTVQRRIESARQSDWQGHRNQDRAWRKIYRPCAPIPRKSSKCS